MTDQEYLEPGFDPATLTVPRLRSILVAHSVNYPSSAKKPQLIDLFNEHVASQARKLKAASLRVKRTSRGIVDVGSQGTAEDEEEESVPPPPSTGRRRTTRARTEEAQEVVPQSAKVRHSTAPPEGTTPRRASSKHARTAEKLEEEPEPKRPASRKSRLSAQTPIAKQEPVDDDSPFSNDNVFQSGGSSPPPTTDRRRTTMSAGKDADRRRSRDAARRRTDEVKPARQQMDGAIVPTRKTFNPPVSRGRKQEVEPSEEFTPEEEQELVRAQQAGELVPARPRQPAGNTANMAFGSVFVALLAGCATLYGQEKYKVGFCEVGHPSTEIAGVVVPEWANIVRPQCEPCPAHAYCKDDLQIECDPNFVLTHHPLTLGGQIPLPLPPTCEPDTARARHVEQIKERAIDELRKTNAQFACGESTRPYVKEADLKATINKQRRKSSMADKEFEELWSIAIGEVEEATEVSKEKDGSLRSNSLARISLACSVRRSLRETLREYVWQLVGIVLAATSAFYGRYRITSGRDMERRAKLLAGEALNHLSDQASLHAMDPNRYRENYIPVAQLRDNVLRNEFHTKTRRALWNEVQKKVEKNSNVRPMVRDTATGDVGRVWEWVGQTRMIESPPNSNDNKRVSFGGATLYEPPSGYDSTEMSEVSRWNESRQYY